jgi:hypothetical protein
MSRWMGRFPWGSGGHWYSPAPNYYTVEGRVIGGGGSAPITSDTVTLDVDAGTSGAITLEVHGEYFGMVGGNVLTRSVARGTYRVTQAFPYRCTPEGGLTIDTAAIVRGSATNDPHPTKAFGILETELGMSFDATSDGSSFLLETITFVGDTEAHAVAVRVDLNVVGARARHGRSDSASITTGTSGDPSSSVATPAAPTPTSKAM